MNEIPHESGLNLEDIKAVVLDTEAYLQTQLRALPTPANSFVVGIISCCLIVIVFIIGWFIYQNSQKTMFHELRMLSTKISNLENLVKKIRAVRKGAF